MWRMDVAFVFGSVAAILTTSAFLPQIVHTLRTRDTRGISLAMYFTFTAGVATWTVYGVLIRQWPVIVANAVTLTLSGAVLGLKLKNG
jgi:MtN3 and saliva related transmembrane protein